MRSARLNPAPRTRRTRPPPARVRSEIVSVSQCTNRTPCHSLRNH
jgi:hypothetical protein